jgi:cyanate permease
MMVGVGYAIGAVGPFGVGGVRDYLGSYGPSFLVLVLLSASLFLMVVWFRPDRRIHA